MEEGKAQTENQVLKLKLLVNQISLILDSVQNVSQTLGMHTNSISGTMDTVKQVNTSINKISLEAKNHSSSVNQLSSAIENTKSVDEHTLAFAQTNEMVMENDKITPI